MAQVLIVEEDTFRCELHRQAFRESRLFECERCHRYDDISLASGAMTEDAGLCGECRQGANAPDHYHGASERRCQHLYILTLDGGDFHLGLTDHLERQVKEHYLGRFPSTAGRNPQLVWSEKWVGDSVKLQKRMERLTKLFSKDPRAVLYNLQARLPLGGFHWG
jgi:predicted GIY-YIG superfamily endonuclease